MWRRLLIVGMVFIVALILLTPSTWAFDEEVVPCEQAVLEGTWSVRVGVKDEFGNHFCWETCNLTVDATGVIAPGGTYVDCSQTYFDITGGELTVFSNCMIEGYIDTSNGTFYMATGTIAGEEQLVLGRDEE